jgi:hypothetical protein
MPLGRRLLSGGFLALLAACGSETVTTEPGALVITLNGPPPSLTNAGTLAVTGQVTRTPAADLPIVVNATGGPNAVSDTAADDGSFALAVGLTLNAQNTLTISASDASGSSVTPVSVEVEHDGRAPQVSAMTPVNESDGVSPATVTVVFNEPVKPGSAALALSVQGVSVPGSAVLSADSLSLAFTPSGPLAGNAVHVVSVNAEDQLGNAAASLRQCFVTGGSGISVFTDPENDGFVDGTPGTALVPVDLRELRLSQSGGNVHGVLRFSGPRSIDPTASNTVFVVLDLDIDQDGATGFVSLKDTVFQGLLAASGARVEYTIGLAAGIGVAGDSAFAASYTAPLQFQTTSLFLPGFCGALAGFVVPMTALGNDDGAFDVVGYLDALDATGAYYDPAPDTGVFSAMLTSAGPGLRLGASAARGSRRFRYPLRLTRSR